MKNLIAALMLFVTVTTVAQTTRIVDNNFNAPTGPYIYSTLQAAANAANPGDTIQVQPSPNTYGSISINKQIVLVGIGFNVVKDIPLGSRITHITLTNNSDNTTDASGTVITGLYFAGLFPGYKTNSSLDTLRNVTLYNCRLSYIQGNNSYAVLKGFDIYDNYITTTYSGNACLYFPNVITNSLIRNNLLLSGIYFGHASPGTNTITNNILYGPIGVIAQGTNTNIINNTFVGAANSSVAFYSTLRDCIVSYNIFYGRTPSIAAAGSTSTNFQRNVFTYNLVHSTGDQTMPPTGGGAGNSGSPNYTGSPLFTAPGVQLLNTWSSTYDFTLQPGSPALQATHGGLSDIGITGGSYPWTESNFSLQTTKLPVIEVLNTATIINPGDPLPVNVKATSH